TEITIKGTVYGDVYCAGQKVTVDATVYGDVLCAGMDVTILGKVEGDVRAAGQFVTLKGEVSKSASIASMNFTLDAGAKIGQDLTATGTQLNLNGSIGRDVVANGDKVMLDGLVARNAAITGSEVELQDGAHVTGSLHYTSERDAAIASSARVDGETHRSTPVEHKQDNGGFSIMPYLFMLVAFTIMVIVLAALFPRFMQKTSGQIIDSPLKTLAVGLVGSIVVIAILVGLLITLVGIPLALLLMLASIVGALLTGPVVAYWIGRLILRNKETTNPVLAALIGSPILIVLSVLPWIGPLAMLVAYWFGLGALLLALWPYVGKITPATASMKPSSNKAKKK
ncbi:MAG TPA: hypothetical protein VFT59_01075, partial [Candidatus Saccharimonadales bacterium]|nr:hypothetical protein [Candidatus Saccharimonadales bacterium]